MLQETATEVREISYGIRTTGLGEQGTDKIIGIVLR
jgi:hypothetical protein